MIYAQSFLRVNPVCVELAAYENNSALQEGSPNFWNNFSLPSYSGFGYYLGEFVNMSSLDRFFLFMLMYYKYAGLILPVGHVWSGLLLISPVSPSSWTWLVLGTPRTSSALPWLAFPSNAADFEINKLSTLTSRRSRIINFNFENCLHDIVINLSGLPLQRWWTHQFEAHYVRDGH